MNNECPVCHEDQLVELESLLDPNDKVLLCLTCDYSEVNN